MPISFSDPFGLCEKDDKECQRVADELRAQKGSEFQDAAKRYDALKGRRVHVLSGTDPRMNVNGENGDGDPETWWGGLTTENEVLLNSDQSKGDFLITAVHESYHFGKGVQTDRGKDLETLSHAEWRAYNQLPSSLRGGAVRTSDKFFHWWGPTFGKHPVPTKEPIVKWP